MYGINPGGLAASGNSPESAQEAFRQTFSKVLIDLVMDTDSFDAFRAAVQQFFDETNDGYEPEWLAAVESVRRRETVVLGLEQVPAESPRSLRVELRPVPRVQDNVPELSHALAA
jgi:hypothetical protein